MIIDDDDALCAAMQAKFSDKGYAITICKDGNEAIDTMNKEKFDVIITDLHMPNKDGFAVLEEQKKTLNAGVPTYVITNLGSDTFCDRALALGAQKCFVKSLLSLRDIVEIVDHATR